MPAPTVLDGGHLTIDGFEIGVNRYGAWRVINLPVLWAEAKQRGADRVLPGVAGQKAYQRRRDVTEFTLDMQIFGDVFGSDGSAVANQRIALQANWFSINAGIVKPTGLTDGTRTAVLYLPDTTTLTAPVHVTGFEAQDWTQSSHFVFAELTLSIPSGTFNS